MSQYAGGHYPEQYQPSSKQPQPSYKQPSHAFHDQVGYSGTSDPAEYAQRAPRPTHHAHQRPSRDQYSSEPSAPAPRSSHDSHTSNQAFPENSRPAQPTPGPVPARSVRPEYTQRGNTLPDPRKYAQQDPRAASYDRQDTRGNARNDLGPTNSKIYATHAAPQAPYNSIPRPSSRNRRHEDPSGYHMSADMQNMSMRTDKQFARDHIPPSNDNYAPRKQSVPAIPSPTNPYYNAPQSRQRSAPNIAAPQPGYDNYPRATSTSSGQVQNPGPPIAPYAATHRPNSPSLPNQQQQQPRSNPYDLSSVPVTVNRRAQPGYSEPVYDKPAYNQDPYGQPQQQQPDHKDSGYPDDLYTPPSHSGFYPPPRPIQDSTGRASPSTLAKRMYHKNPPNTTAYPTASSYDLAYEEEKSQHDTAKHAQYTQADNRGGDERARALQPTAPLQTQTVRSYAPLNPPGPTSPSAAAEYRREIAHESFDQYDYQPQRTHEEEALYTRSSDKPATTATSAISPIESDPGSYGTGNRSNGTVTHGSQHGHNESTSSSGSGSGSGSNQAARPPPRRNYSATSGPASETAADNSSNKALTVEEFERLRRQAANRPQDYKLQLELAKKYVEAAVGLASRYSDPNTPSPGGHGVDSKHERKNREAWMSAAFKLVKKLAHSGSSDAIFYLGSQYSNGGMGLEIDYDKAYELYLKAANKDQAEAAYRVAVCNEIGAGTKRDPVKAINWYKKASLLGDVSAMYKLGMISLNGLLGQPRSFMEAVTWLQRAAERADKDTPHAVHELGLLYERADSLDMSAVNEAGTASVITRDDKKAYDLFVKAAKLGYAPSQFHLGAAHEYGSLGCNIDPKRSIAWYSRAAEKGEPESELALSGWYLTGSEGILQQSDTEAYLWARKAAEKGLAKAEYALGYFSEVGIGIKANADEAKKWYYRAAAQRHPKAVTRLQEMKNDHI